MTKKSAIAVYSLVAAFVAADPIVYAYNSWKDLPTNARCEAQLPSLIEKHDLPGNGASRYSPWTRQCSYRYYDYKSKDKSTDADDNIKTFEWSPIFH